MRVLIAVIAVVAFLALGAFVLWRLAFPPPPTGYYWPQHTVWGGGPLALFTGHIIERDGCFYADAGSGPESLVIWPMFSSVAIDDGEPLLTTHGRSFRLGEEVALGGGFYDDGPLPESARSVLEVPCAGPYFLTTGPADVDP
jgi:hypothetical protein